MDSLGPLIIKKCHKWDITAKLSLNYSNFTFLHRVQGRLAERARFRASLRNAKILLNAGTSEDSGAHASADATGGGDEGSAAGDGDGDGDDDATRPLPQPQPRAASDGGADVEADASSAMASNAAARDGRAVEFKQKVLLTVPPLCELTTTTPKTTTPAQLPQTTLPVTRRAWIPTVTTRANSCGHALRPSSRATTTANVENGAAAAATAAPSSSYHAYGLRQHASEE